MLSAVVKGGLAGPVPGGHQLRPAAHQLLDSVLQALVETAWSHCHPPCAAPPSRYLMAGRHEDGHPLLNRLLAAGHLPRVGRAAREL